MGSGTKTISWKEGVSVAVVAAVIASVFGAGVAAVIASAGSNVISVIAGTAIGGKIKYTLYETKVSKMDK